MIQKEIFNSKDLYRTALANLNAMMFSFDVGSQKLVIETMDWVKEFENVPESLIEDKIIHPIDADKVKALRDELKKGHLPQNVQIRCHKCCVDEFLWYQIIPFEAKEEGDATIIYGCLRENTREHELCERVFLAEERVFHNQELLERKLLQYTCQKDFYMLVVIDGNTGQAWEWLHHAADEQRFIEIDNIDANSVRYFNRNVDSENVDAIIEKTRLKKVLEELESNEKYNVFFEGKNSKGIKSYFKAEFTYIDKNKKLICYTCVDVSATVAMHKENQEMIRHTMEMGEAAQKAKNNFFANMSHEIRTPLNAIVGMAEIAKMDINNPCKVAECMDIMLASCQNLVNVVSNILDSSSMQSKGINITPTKTRVKSLIEKAEKEFSETIKKPNQKFEVKLDIKHEYAMLDSNRALRVINNLLTNAAKFSTDRGSIGLSIEEIPGKNPTEGFYKLVISDDGKGISKEDKEHVFEPFYRDKEAKENYLSGTGLGLSVVKSIVDAKGATIEIDSEPNRGTSVTIMDPVKFVEEERAKLIADNKILEGHRVLLAEDQPINLLVAKRMLERFGAKVDTAEHGRFAVEQYLSHEEGTYDLIFMDIQMPLMDGYEATRKIRESGRGDAKGIKIISMTANVLPEDVELAKQAGMDAHIGKPIRTEELQQLIMQMLEA